MWHCISWHTICCGLNSSQPATENKLHIYRQIKGWNGTFPIACLNTARAKNDGKMTAEAKNIDHIVNCSPQKFSGFSLKVAKYILWQTKSWKAWRHFSGLALSFLFEFNKFGQILVESRFGSKKKGSSLKQIFAKKATYGGKGLRKKKQPMEKSHLWKVL